MRTGAAVNGVFRFAAPGRFRFLPALRATSSPVATPSETASPTMATAASGRGSSNPAFRRDPAAALRPVSLRPRSGVTCMRVVGALRSFRAAGAEPLGGGAMSRICVLAAACVLLAAPAAGQDRAPWRALNEMAWQIFREINAEARRTDERPQVSFRPARTTVQEGMDIWCGPLSFGLRNALHERVQSRLDNMAMSPPFDVAVADARAVSPPDVTMTWAWDGTESIGVGAHVLLAGERSKRYSASLPVSGLGERERACLFTFRPGGGEAEAKTAGVLREEPTFDAARIVRRFEAGDKLLVAGELSGEAENGVVWSVVLWQDPETGRFRNLFAAALASGRGGP